MYNKALEIAIAAILICAAWFYAGHRAVANYKQEVALEQAAANAAQQAKYDTLAADYETLKTKREANARVIVREVEKVIAGDVVYRNICVTDSGMLLANEALAGSSKPVSDATVQAAE